MSKANIVYLHGYKGENSIKFKILKDAFESKYNVIKIKQIAEPLKNLEKMENEISYLNNNFLIGSSLGGFYSIYLSLKYDLPALLINPSFNPDMGQLRNEFSEEYINQFKIIKKEILKMFEDKTQFLMAAFIAKDDELLSHDELISIFDRKEIKYILFDNKGHGFSDFQNELNLIDNEINLHMI